LQSVGTTGGQMGGNGLGVTHRVGVRTVPVTDKTTGNIDLRTRHRLKEQQTTSSIQMQGPQLKVRSHAVLAPSGAQRMTVLKKLALLVEVQVTIPAEFTILIVSEYETRNVTSKKPAVVLAVRDTSVQLMVVSVQLAVLLVQLQATPATVGVNAERGRHTSCCSVWKQKSNTWGTSMQMVES